MKFLPLAEEHPDAVGRVNGLAWTIAGGEVLDTEAVTIKGKGHLILTGQMGDVMKESAETAYTYIRSKARTRDSRMISMKPSTPTSTCQKAPYRKTARPQASRWQPPWHLPIQAEESEAILL